MFEDSERIRCAQSLTPNSLPPISARLCCCDVHHGRFVDQHVQDIEKFIYEEIKELRDAFHDSKKDRFAVFRKGFEMLIEESVSFKPLLSDINAEYLDVIKAAENGEHQRAYITRNLKRLVGGKGTLDNYEKRIRDLQWKAEKIRVNNEELQAQIKELRVKNQETCSAAVQDESSLNASKTCRLFIPGLEMEEQTNIQTLSTSLAKMRADAKTAQENMDSKFRPKDQKLLLQQNLRKKETEQYHIRKYNTELKERLGKLNIAVEVAKANGQYKDQDTKPSMYDAVLKALYDYEKRDPSQRRDPLQQLISTDEDDPQKKKESERLMAYVEHFNDLFDFGQYATAAIHAASSPKGILRTPLAMQKFKEVEVYEGPKSPLFLFCEALMTTSINNKGGNDLQLSAAMSVECIKCALKESGIRLAIHWLNQPCIVVSLPLADLLSNFCRCVGNCSCKCQAVSEAIYQKMGAHRQVALALTRQGKHRAVLEYGKTHGDFRLADYKAILQCNPSLYLATMLLQARIRNRKTANGISFCAIASILLAEKESGDNVLISFLEQVESNGVCDSKGVKYTIKDLIFQETASDEMGNDKWDQIVGLCYDSGHTRLAVEILSILLVREALNHAEIASSMDYIS